MSVRGWLSGAGKHEKIQIPSDLVVKPQLADIIDLVLQLIGHPNGVHRPCRNRKSRGAVLSTSEGQWATTKFDGVWNLRKTHRRSCPMMAVSQRASCACSERAGHSHHAPLYRRGRTQINPAASCAT